MVATKMALEKIPEASSLQVLGFLEELMVHDRKKRCDIEEEKELPGRQKNNVGAACMLLASLDWIMN